MSTKTETKTLTLVYEYDEYRKDFISSFKLLEKPFLKKMQKLVQPPETDYLRAFMHALDRGELNGSEILCLAAMGLKYATMPTNPIEALAEMMDAEDKET